MYQYKIECCDPCMLDGSAGGNVSGGVCTPFSDHATGTSCVGHHAVPSPGMCIATSTILGGSLPLYTMVSWHTSHGPRVGVVRQYQSTQIPFCLGRENIQNGMQPMHMASSANTQGSKAYAQPLMAANLQVQVGNRGGDEPKTKV